MPFMLPSMKRLAVSSHLFFPLVPFHLRASAEGAASASRGSVILLFALIKGKRLSSPAHEGNSRGVGQGMPPRRAEASRFIPSTHFERGTWPKMGSVSPHHRQSRFRRF